MSNIFDNIPLEDIQTAVNLETTAGVMECEVYAAVASHIDSFPALPVSGTAATSLTDFATLTADITFPAGKGFFKLDTQVETGEVKDDMVGNVGNRKFKKMFEFFLPDTSAKNIGFMGEYANVPLVFAIKEKSGRVRLVGSKDLPAYFESVAGTSGKGSEDDNGWQCAIYQTSKKPAPVYTGNITEVP
jgi:hypothetical protein